MLVGVASALVMIGLVACGQPEAPPAEAEPEQTEPEGEQEEPEWLQRRIDRFTRKLRLAEEERDELEKEV